MRNTSLYRMALCAVFAALCCVATMVIAIPVPATTGYMNLGDCCVLLSAFCLGPYTGALAAGVGSAMADLLLGYVQYVPATFLIKAAMPLIAGLLCRVLLLHRRTPAFALLARSVSGALAELWMALGYFLYESLLLGYGLGALASIPQNLIQGGVGLVLAVLLFGLIRKIPSIRHQLPAWNR